MQRAAPIQNAVPSAPWYAHRWPWILMAGPFLVVVAGIITGWLAYSRPDALVVDDYYKEGKAINQDLRRDRTAASMQLQIKMRYDAAAGKLIGSIGSTTKPVAGKIMVRLVHSTQPEKDIVREALPDEAGRFSVDLAMLDQANWRVLVEDQARVWRLTGAWVWPKQQSVALKADPAAVGG